VKKVIAVIVTAFIFVSAGFMASVSLAVEYQIPSADVTTEEILGEEYVSFLSEIGVSIIDGNLQVETVEQFTAIANHYSEYLKSLGFGKVDANTLLLWYNFDEVSGELKKELANRKLIMEKPEMEMSLAVEGYDDYRFMSVVGDVYSNNKFLCFKRENIIFANSVFELSMYDFELCINGNMKERARIVAEVEAYAYGKSNDILPYVFTDLMGIGATEAITLVCQMFWNGITAGATVGEDLWLLGNEGVPVMDKHLEYQRYVIANYPVADRVK